MESIVENLMPIFKSVSGRSLMVYTLSDKEEVIHYQLQMLANNDIPGILKADSIGLDGEIHLHFDITSLIPIKKLLERRKMGRQDILNLIRDIVAMMEGLEQYLLDPDRAVFDSRYIFADPQELKLNFTYLPIKSFDNNAVSLKSFLSSLIINDIQFADEQSDNFLQKLIELLKTEEFKVSTLRAYIKDMGTEKKIAPLDLQPAEPRTVSAVKEPIPSIVKPNANTVIKVSKLGYPTKSYIIMGSVIAALVLFCLTLIISGVMSPSNPDSLLSLFGFLMIGGAVTYLVYTKVFTPDKKVEKIALPQKVEYVNKAFTVPVQLPGKKESQPANKESNLKRPEALSPSPVQTARQEAAAAIKVVNQENAVAASAADAAARTKINIPVSDKQRQIHVTESVEPKKTLFTSSAAQYKDKTVILDCGRLKLPHLKRKLGNSFETIILNSFPFMLGRLENQVNYCINNPAIGKLHAEINYTPDGFIITDMNSLNGTFVNGERVQTGKEMELKNGDRITLGNEEFQFYNE